MEYVDTHAHIFVPEFDDDRAQVMTAALAAGVRRMLMPAVEPSDFGRMAAVRAAWPDRCFPLAGLHPTSVNDNPRWREDLAAVEQALRQPHAGGFCGVGEIGLDYYWSRDFCGEQREAFVRQVELSIELGLPVAVHTRDAWDDMTDIMRSFAGRGVKGIFHSFSGSEEVMRELAACGDFLFGAGGPVTYKKSLMRVIRAADISQLVLETDCPYQSPEPHCGTRNEPAYIPLICSKIAELKGLGAEQVAEITTRNAERMFGLPAAH